MIRLGGWWRLWIVCSALWVAFITTFGVVEWPSVPPPLIADGLNGLSPQSRAMLYNPALAQLEKDLSALPDDPAKPPYPVPAPDDDKGPWLKYQKGKKAAASGWTVLPDSEPILFLAPDGLQRKLNPETTFEQLEAFKADYIRAQHSLLVTKRFDHARKMSLLALIPCGVILLLGLSVRWVFRGFKKEAAVGQ